MSDHLHIEDRAAHGLAPQQPCPDELVVGNDDDEPSQRRQGQPILRGGKKGRKGGSESGKERKVLHQPKETSESRGRLIPTCFPPDTLVLCISPPPPPASHPHE